MAAKHTEVERKYEIDDPAAADTVTTDDWLASELGYVAGPRQTHQLDATYYDSEDLRLGAARVTLRRRTGGGDAGWHLKLPHTGDARTELHRPLGRSLDPPLTLTRLVRGVVGGRPLAPVATIRTRRTEWPLLDDEGQVLAVVARDEVTAHAADSADSPMHWVEIEVELVDGEVGLLDQVDEALASAGIQRSSSASKVGRVLADKHAASAEPERKTAAALVRGYLAEHLEAFVAADLALRASNAGVHDLRVESRRLRTILAVYRNLFDESRARNLQHELKWIGQILGQLRDIEVTFERLEQALDDDPTAGPGPSTITPARRLLSTEQRIAKTAVQRSLASERYASLVDAIYDFVSDPPWTGRARKSAKRSLPKFSGKPHKKLRKRANKLSDPDHGVAERHEVRKAARRLRYSVEVLRPIDKRADKLRKRSKDLQSALGDYLDDRGLGAVLWRLRLEPVPASRAFVYGRLHARTETMTATHLERAHDELGTTLKTAANYP